MEQPVARTPAERVTRPTPSDLKPPVAPALTVRHQWLLTLQQSAGNHAVVDAVRAPGRSPGGRSVRGDSPRNVVQRAIGWTRPGGAPTTGHNAGEENVFKIRRFPVEDPALGAAGGNTAADRKVAAPGKPAVTAETADNKAIVLVPEKIDPKADVEVILFFHGINVGNRSFGADRVRDLDVDRDRMEQQMAAGGSAQLVAVLPQGTSGGSFGTLTADTTKYVGAALAAVAPALGSPLNQRGGIIAGGHSGGGNKVADLATAEAARDIDAEPSLKGIVLFDGINNFGREEVGPDPKDPTKTIKVRTDNLAADDKLKAYIAMCEKRIDHDIKKLKNGAPATFLNTSFVFRAYFQGDGLYALVHGLLSNALQMMFGEKPPKALGHGVSSTVKPQPRPDLAAVSGQLARLRQNYQVIKVGTSVDRATHDATIAAGKMDTLRNGDTTGGHDAMVGSGAFQDALGNINGVGRGAGLTPGTAPSPSPAPAPKPAPPPPSPHAMLEQIFDLLGPSATPEVREQLLAAADSLEVVPPPIVTARPVAGDPALLGFAGSQQAAPTALAAGVAGESAAVTRARAASGLMAHTGGTERPVLRTGSSGTAVEEMQGLLNSSNVGGEPLDVDGKFGPKTGTAVGKFQQQHQLSADRVVGKQTWGALDGGSAENDEATTPPGRQLELLDRGGDQVTAAPPAQTNALIGFPGGLPLPPPFPRRDTAVSDDVIASAINFSRPDGKAKPDGGSFLRQDDVRTALANRAADAELAKLLADVDLVAGKIQGFPRFILIALWTKLVLQTLERKFILDPNKSALDLLPPAKAKGYKDFKWDKNDYPGAGPGEAAGPNEAKAAAMAADMSKVRPERRPNSGADAVMTADTATPAKRAFIQAHLAAVPGQAGAQLYDEAAATFGEMTTKSALDGVTLRILSSWRDPATAAANAKKSGNANAVASFSSHSLGLAADLQMSAGALKVSEMSTHPMQDVADERSSPAHKWMVLRGEEFGWFPFGNEPWHWEYNPSGLRERFFSRMTLAPKP